MRNTNLIAAFLTSAALSVPALAWAGPDCGNEPVKTAEAVFVIPTPQQALAPRVQPIEATAPRFDTVAPSQAPLPTAPAVNAPVVNTAAPAPQIVKVAEAAPNVSPATAAYSAVLQRRIKRGEAGLNLFDYAGALAAGEAKVIKAYTDELASQNPDLLPEADQIAYWANLYNALTVNLILENYPVKSIRKIKAGAFSIGPWKRDEVTVNGKVLSLNDIEHEILRKRYPDPAMVHYMVNCASIGCPNLLPKLWVGATLDADREQAARDFINSPRGVEIKGNELKVSSIYDWFKVDFGGSKSATLDHFRKFAGPELRSALDAGADIDGYGYNWDLNE
jgi:hypothetical protein